MVFKEIRNLIFSPVELIIDGEHAGNVVLNDFTELYDDYEVIGIRADYDEYVIKHQDYDYIESRVVISLKETLTTTRELGNPYHNKDKYKTYDNVNICKD